MTLMHQTIFIRCIVKSFLFKPIYSTRRAKWYVGPFVIQSSHYTIKKSETQNRAVARIGRAPTDGCLHKIALKASTYKLHRIVNGVRRRGGITRSLRLR